MHLLIFVGVLVATVTLFIYFFSRGIVPYVTFLVEFILFSRLIASVVSEYGQWYNIAWLMVYYSLFAFWFVFKYDKIKRNKRLAAFSGLVLVLIAYLSADILLSRVLSLSQMLITVSTYFIGLPLFFMVGSLVISKGDLKRIIVAIFVAGIIQLVLGYSQVLLSHIIPGYYDLFAIQYANIGGKVRDFLESNLLTAARFPIGSLGRYNDYGEFIATFLIFILYSKRYLSGLWKSYGNLHWFVVGLLFVILYLSDSRLSLVGFVGAVVLYTIFKKGALRGALLLTMFAAFFYLMIPVIQSYSMKPDLAKRAETSIIDTWRQTLTLNQDFASGRTLTDLGFLNLWLQKPIFGFGPGSFSVHDNPSISFLGPDVPSNDYALDSGWICILSELGLVGFTILVLVLKFPFSAIRKIDKTKLLNGRFSSLHALSTASFVACMCILIMTFANTGYFMRHLNFFYYLLLALPVAIERGIQKSGIASQLRRS